MSTLQHLTSSPLLDPPHQFKKKKRRPAGTPDPDADVVSLSPRTLLESDRYICEICGQGFQRDQNLQMHRRRHKVPWRLLKRDPPAEGAGAGEARKRVFVCPEPSCLHHDPGHALGDLVGIKKHYRRKHSDRRQWVCERCSKGYAVQSDYKAHLKTCGTRGHTCDCGKVFSRVESFIEHQDTCNSNRIMQDSQIPQASSPSPSSTEPWPSFLRPSLELQLLPPSTTFQPTATTNNKISTTSNDDQPYGVAHLDLSLGPSSSGDQAADGGQQLRMVEDARKHAKRQVELAEKEYENAKRIRQQAQVELNNAFIWRDHAAKSINSILLQITCQSCRHKMWPKPPADHESSLAASVVTDNEHK